MPKSAAEDVVDIIHGDSALTGVAYDYGRLATEEHADHARAQWVWTDGVISPDTMHAGGGLDGSGNRNRVVRTDRANLMVEVWGEDEAECHSLLKSIVSAAYRRLGGSVEFGAYEWLDQSETGAEWMTSGRLLRASVVVVLPIHAEEKPLTTITSHSHTGTFTSDLDGSEEVVC